MAKSVRSAQLFIIGIVSRRISRFIFLPKESCKKGALMCLRTGLGIERTRLEPRSRLLCCLPKQSISLLQMPPSAQEAMMKLQLQTVRETLRSSQEEFATT